MKNAAIDRTVGKIVITLIQNVFQLRKRDMVSALLVVHLLNRLPCPLCLFLGKEFLLFLFLPQFASSNFRCSASICPRIRCSAGAPDGNEVLVRTGTVTHWTGCKFIKIFLIGFCSDETIESRCSILEGSFTSRTIFRTFSAVRLSGWRMCTLHIAEILPVAFPSLRRRRAIFRLLAFSGHFTRAVFQILVCFRLDCGILTSSNRNLRLTDFLGYKPDVTELWHQEFLDDEDDYIMHFRRRFCFPKTRLYSFCIFEHILLMLHRCS